MCQIVETRHYLLLYLIYNIMKKKKSDRKSARRRNLMKEDPHCHWCRRELKTQPHNSGKIPDDFPTLDHMNSRVKYPKGRPARGKIVLACPPCNTKRAMLEQHENMFRHMWNSRCFPWYLYFLHLFRRRCRGCKHR